MSYVLGVASQVGIPRPPTLIPIKLPGAEINFQAPVEFPDAGASVTAPQELPPASSAAGASQGSGGGSLWPLAVGAVATGGLVWWLLKKG